jgi:hypothetical protein
MIRPIAILKELIETTAHTVVVDSIVDNGGGSYTIETCNTFYLNFGKKFTISAVEYTVTSFVLNESITFTGASLPNVTSFEIDPPRFIYGTPKFINAELTKTNFTGKYPYIWLVEISNTEHDASPSARIKSTPNFSLLFLDEMNKTGWTIEDHYENAIDTQLNEIDFFIKTLKKRRDLFETESLTYETINHANFGVYISDKGYDKKILSDDVSGAQLQIKIPYIVDTCNGCDAPIISICNPVTIEVDGVFSEYVASGGSYNCVTGGGSFSYDFYVDGVDTGSDVVVDGTDIDILW